MYGAAVDRGSVMVKGESTPSEPWEKKREKRGTIHEAGRLMKLKRGGSRTNRWGVKRLLGVALVSDPSAVTNQ